jgi:DNA polymerase III epsilon subunit-like protein
MCAVDLETTGTDSRKHEFIQIAVVPVDSNFRALKDVPAFYTNVKPERLDLEDRVSRNTHALDIEDLVLYAPSKDEVADQFISWFEKLQLPIGKSIVPLAHNWVFEAGFLRSWLGQKLFEKMFWGHPRDSMQLALSINDRAVMRGESAPFSKVSLGSLARKFGIGEENYADIPGYTGKAHDAFQDCLVCAEVYRNLLQYSLV